MSKNVHFYCRYLFFNFGFFQFFLDSNYLYKLFGGTIGPFFRVFVLYPLNDRLIFEYFRQNPHKYVFFENFGKNRFTIDNRVFRVFVEIPIGKILALFDVFPAIDTVITIDTVIFSIDNDIQYFPPKNHFLYWKNGFQKILEVEKKFSQQHESVGRSTPHQCCWENVKKCQNFTYWYFDKNSKNTIINRETVFTKIFEKTRTYGDFDETFHKLARRF